MSVKEIYETIFEIKKTNASALEKSADLGDKTVRRAIERDSSSISAATAKKINALYPDIRLEWLLTGKGDPITVVDDSEEIKKKDIPDRNARLLGLPVGIHTTKSGNQFVELSEGQFLMSAPVVTIRARAGFVGGGYGDPEFIDSLPVQSIVVDQVHHGRYLWFVIDGDSMNDGKVEHAIPDKTKVLAREIKLELWRSKFHYNEYPAFVIVHKTDGILCKEIIDHDVKGGSITCHSLNPNKHMYPDFILKLDDCVAIYNVVRRDLDSKSY